MTEWFFKNMFLAKKRGENVEINEKRRTERKGDTKKNFCVITATSCPNTQCKAVTVYGFMSKLCTYLSVRPRARSGVCPSSRRCSVGRWERERPCAPEAETEQGEERLSHQRVSTDHQPRNLTASAWQKPFVFRQCGWIIIIMLDVFVSLALPLKWIHKLKQGTPAWSLC